MAEERLYMMGYRPDSSQTCQ